MRFCLPGFFHFCRRCFPLSQFPIRSSSKNNSRRRRTGSCRPKSKGASGRAANAIANRLGASSATMDLQSIAKVALVPGRGLGEQAHSGVAIRRASAWLSARRLVPQIAPSRSRPLVQAEDWIGPHSAGVPFVEKPPLYFLVAEEAADLLAPWLPLHDAARRTSVFRMVICLG